MLQRIGLAITAFALTFVVIQYLQSGSGACRIVVTGASAVVHNCPVTEELAKVLQVLKPAEHGSL